MLNDLFFRNYFVAFFTFVVSWFVYFHLRLKLAIKINSLIRYFIFYWSRYNLVFNKRRFLFQLCWSASSLDANALNFSVSSFLYHSLFHHRLINLRLCDDINEKFQFTINISSRSSCLIRKRILYNQWEKYFLKILLIE